MKIIHFIARIILVLFVINIIVYVGIVIINREVSEYGGTFVNCPFVLEAFRDGYIYKAVEEIQA